METHLVISALGKDHHGLVQHLSQAVVDCGCRVRECRMMVFGSHFAAVMLVAGNWSAVAKLETTLARLEEKLSLSIRSQRTEPRTGVSHLIPYGVEVVSAENPRTLHDVASFFSRRDINIEDVYTTAYSAPHTGTAMFSLHMTVGIPAETSVAALRGEFMDFCDELNLDAMLAPVK